MKERTFTLDNLKTTDTIVIVGLNSSIDFRNLPIWVFAVYDNSTINNFEKSSDEILSDQPTIFDTLLVPNRGKKVVVKISLSIDYDIDNIVVRIKP